MKPNKIAVKSKNLEAENKRLQEENESLRERLAVLESRIGDIKQELKSEIVSEVTKHFREELACLVWCSRVN